MYVRRGPKSMAVGPNWGGARQAENCPHPSGAKRAGGAPALQVSLREAPVGQRDSHSKPDNNPEVVPDGQRRLSKEWVSGARPAGDPGSGDDLGGLEVEDRAMP